MILLFICYSHVCSQCSLQIQTRGRRHIEFTLTILCSWYLNDPENKWEGFKYHEARLSEFVKNYKYSLFVGNSMGGTGALLFCHLASAVIVFNPQVDLSLLRTFTVRYILVIFIPYFFFLSLSLSSSVSA